MITPGDLYNVLSALVPLYFAIFLAYAAVRWWKLFTAEQCAGINRFVAMFAVPLLNFEFISRIDLSKMDLPFISADTLSKILVLVALFAWARMSKKGGLEWCITLFSLSTLPNTLLMGIPLLKAMYGDEQESLMIQVVVLQSIIWYTLLIFLFEYRAARDAIAQGFMESSVKSVSSEARNVGKDEVVHVLIACNSQDLDEQMEACSRDEDNKKGEKKLGYEDIGAANKYVEKSTMPSGTIGLILRMVWYQLMKNPNFYASVGGLCWALASSRWNIKKPMIMENSVTILSNCALGVAMFSLGNFMALQPKFVACGKKMAAYGMLIRFIVGPAIMALASLVVGIGGKKLKVSIIQAALPQAVVPFVFAREYDVHPKVLSTVVMFGMIVSLPITILYYVFLEFIIPRGALDAMLSASASNLCNMPSIIVKPLDCYLWTSIRQVNNVTKPFSS